jgi:hypothetical protein
MKSGFASRRVMPLSCQPRIAAVCDDCNVPAPRCPQGGQAGMQRAHASNAVP